MILERQKFAYELNSAAGNIDDYHCRIGRRDARFDALGEYIVLQ